MTTGWRPVMIACWAVLPVGAQAAAANLEYSLGSMAEETSTTARQAAGRDTTAVSGEWCVSQSTEGAGPAPRSAGTTRSSLGGWSGQVACSQFLSAGALGCSRVASGRTVTETL